MLEKTRLLVVAKHPNSRMQIKAVASAFMRIEAILQATTTRQGLDCIKNNQAFDVIFISSQFDTKNITDFITKAKSLPVGRKAAFVLLLKAKHQETSYVAKNILDGVDGFVFEPLSVDSFMEVVQTAKDKAKEGPAPMTPAKKKSMMKFLTSDALFHLDKAAQKLAVGQSPGYAMKDFRETAKMLTELANEQEDEYFQIIFDTVEEIPAPKPIANRKKRPKKSEKKDKKLPQAKSGAGYFIRKK
jgi:DNA-binding NarL/FixJ family response regulator